MLRGTLLTLGVAVFLTVAALAGIDRYGRNSRIFGSVGTLQSRHGMRCRVEDPKAAYRVLKEGGYRGRAIVFVSDRWESFDPGELIPAQMFRAYPLELYNTAKLLEDEHLSNVTFLYVASMSKIIRKIVAIVPESEVDRMKGVAKKAKDFLASDKELYVSRQGFPRWYMTGANFTGLGEPVLLYVGASYFKKGAPEDLYRQLSASGLQSDCVILCDELGKEGVTPQEIAKLDRFASLLGMRTPAGGPTGMLTPGTRLNHSPVPVS